jgi:hypothetical protein
MGRQSGENSVLMNACALPSETVRSRWEFKNALVPMSSAPAPRWTKVAKAGSISGSLATPRVMHTAGWPLFEA